jgi:hypothetical protein
MKVLREEVVPLWIVRTNGGGSSFDGFLLLMIWLEFSELGSRGHRRLREPLWGDGTIRKRPEDKMVQKETGDKPKRFIYSIDF